MFPVIKAILFLALLINTAIAAGRATVVNLRIEGADKTIFEGPVLTRGHNVTTATGGTHHCDGTNNHSNPLPGPTCTSALDDASRRHGFGWDGYESPPQNFRLINSMNTGHSSPNSMTFLFPPLEANPARIRSFGLFCSTSNSRKLVVVNKKSKH